MSDTKKNWLVIMTDEMFRELPREYRENLIHIEARERDEYQNHKDDVTYLRLHDAEKKAKKQKQEYLFNKRHKNN